MDSPYSLASATLVPISRMWAERYVPGGVAAARSSRSGVETVKARSSGALSEMSFYLEMGLSRFLNRLKEPIRLLVGLSNWIYHSLEPKTHLLDNAIGA